MAKQQNNIVWSIKIQVEKVRRIDFAKKSVQVMMIIKAK